MREVIGLLDGLYDSGIGGVMVETIRNVEGVDNVLELIPGDLAMLREEGFLR